MTNKLLNNEINFSINICCYNSSKFIASTLNSIILQKYDNWEIIIIDDGSTDETKQIILKYQKKYKNIRYFYHENKGYAFSRNKAITLSKSDWIVILDHDDISCKNRLINHYNAIKSNPNCLFFFNDAFYYKSNKIKYSRFNYILNKYHYSVADLNLKKISAYNYLLKYGCFINTSTVLFNKKIITKENIRFNTNYKFICDYLFFLEISKNYNMHASKEVTTIYRLHDKQTSNRYTKSIYLEHHTLYKSIYLQKNVFISSKIRIFFRHVIMLIKYCLTIK